MSTVYDKAIDYDSSIRYDDIRLGFAKYNVFVDWDNNDNLQVLMMTFLKM